MFNEAVHIDTTVLICVNVPVSVLFFVVVVNGINECKLD